MDNKLTFRERGPGCCAQLWRGLLIICYTLIALGALALIGLGAYVEITKKRSVAQFCTTCQDSVIFAIALFGAMFLFTILGVYALWHRNNCLLAIFAVWVFIFMLGALAISIVFIVIREGGLDNAIEREWRNSVKNSPSDICSLQTDLNCTGWKVLCVNATVNSTWDSVDCAICADQQVQNSYTETCFNTFNSQLDKYFQGLVVTGFFLFAFALVSLAIMWKIRKTDDEDEGTGMYQYRSV